MNEYKVLVVRNRYTKKFNYTKGIEWFSKNTPIKVIFDEVSTDFDLSFRPVGNNTYNGVVAADYYEKLRKCAPEGKYHVICLLYGNKPTGIRVSYTEDIPLYPDTDVIQVVKTDDNGLTLNHELFHTFFKKVNRKGIRITDCMDITVINGVPKPYFKNNSLTAKPSNRTIALDILRDHWDIVVSMNKKNIVTLTRYSDNGSQCLGTVTHDKFKFDSLERPWKNNQNSISCIPKGTYEVDWTFSPKFAKYTYEVRNVLGRSGIRIHSANYYSQLLGCIAIGSGLSDMNRDGNMDIMNSKASVQKFEDILERKPFVLIIK